MPSISTRIGSPSTAATEAPICARASKTPSAGEGSGRRRGKILHMDAPLIHRTGKTHGPAYRPGHGNFVHGNIKTGVPEAEGNSRSPAPLMMTGMDSPKTTAVSPPTEPLRWPRRRCPEAGAGVPLPEPRTGFYISRDFPKGRRLKPPGGASSSGPPGRRSAEPGFPLPPDPKNRYRDIYR
jgi:hypothetical protein